MSEKNGSEVTGHTIGKELLNCLFCGDHWAYYLNDEGYWPEEGCLGCMIESLQNETQEQENAIAALEAEVKRLTEENILQRKMYADLGDRSVPEEWLAREKAEINRLRELLHAAGFTRQPGEKEKP